MAQPHRGTASPLTVLKPSRKSTGSSSAPVLRALASTGAMMPRHSSRCSRMISPMLLKSRSASTCSEAVAAWGWHLTLPRPAVVPAPTWGSPSLQPHHSPHRAAPTPAGSAGSKGRAAGTERELVGCSHSPGPRRGTTITITHIGDDFELADVGGLRVQQLPDGFLLVALPARQGLWG